LHLLQSLLNENVSIEIRNRFIQLKQEMIDRGVKLQNLFNNELIAKPQKVARINKTE
jgi:hypothetical protein